MQAITPARITRLNRDLLTGGGRNGAGLFPRTVAYVHAVLRKAFRDALWSSKSYRPTRLNGPRAPARRPPSLGRSGLPAQLAAFLVIPARGLRRSPGCVLLRRLWLPADQRRTAGAELRSYRPEPTTSSLSGCFSHVLHCAEAAQGSCRCLVSARDCTSWLAASGTDVARGSGQAEGCWPS